MMKVKVFNNESEGLLERDINEFLQKIGSQQNTKINLIDIKFISSAAFNRLHFAAMVIYNETDIK